MTFLASPVNHWHEDPTNGPAIAIAGLVPYQRTDGFWEFLERGTQPAGATRGAMVRTGDFSEPTTSTTTGLRIARGPAAFVYLF